MSAVLLLLSAACGSPEPESSGAMTFTDDLGRSVSIEKTPERVAVLIGSFADVWCLAGVMGSSSTRRISGLIFKEDWEAG